MLTPNTRVFFFFLPEQVALVKWHSIKMITAWIKHHNVPVPCAWVIFLSRAEGIQKAHVIVIDKLPVCFAWDDSFMDTALRKVELPCNLLIMIKVIPTLLYYLIYFIFYVSTYSPASFTDWCPQPKLPLQLSLQPCPSDAAAVLVPSPVSGSLFAFPALALDLAWSPGITRCCLACQQDLLLSPQFCSPGWAHRWGHCLSMLQPPSIPGSLTPGISTTPAAP